MKSIYIYILSIFIGCNICFLKNNEALANNDTKEIFDTTNYFRLSKKSFYNDHNNDLAIHYCNLALSKTPNSLELLNHKLKIYCELGNCDSSLKVTATILRLKDDFETYITISEVLFFICEKKELAIHSLLLYRKENGENTVLLNHLANYYALTDDFEKAEYLFNQVISMGDSSTRVYSNLINCYLANEQIEDAFSLIKKRLSINPDNLEMNLWLSYYYYAIGQDKLAIETTDRIKLRNTDVSEDANIIIADFYKSHNAPKQAHEYYEEALLNNNNLCDITVVFNYFDYEFDSYKSDRLITIMENMRSKCPDNELFKENPKFVAQIYMVNGKIELAKKYVQICIEYNEESEECIEILKQLNDF